MNSFYKFFSEPPKEDTDNYLEIYNFGYHKNIDSMRVFREHGRKDYQLIYINKGNISFKINNRTYVIPDGNVVLYHPDEKQEYFYYKNIPTDYYWIHFSGKGVKKLLSDLMLDGTFFHTGSFDILKDCFDKMIRDVAINDTASKKLLESYLIMILSSASRKVYTAIKPIHRIVEQMQTDSSLIKLTNKDHAKQCGISVNYFIKEFKKETGVTPTQFKNKVLISRAKALFDTTSLNITQVANTLGFEDSLYFSRVFKKETGISPKNYLKQKER